MRLNIQLKIHLPATRHHLNFKCRAKLENLVDILTRAHTRGRAQWRSFVSILRLAKSQKCVKNAPKQVNIMSGAPSLRNLSLRSLFLGTLPSFWKFLGPMRSMQIADALVAASQLLLDGC